MSFLDIVRKSSGKSELPWLRSGDPWMNSILEEKAGMGIPWQFFLSIGMWVRYRTHPNRKALVDTLLTGVIPEELDKERQWAKSLDSQMLESMVISALTSGESLHRVLQELGDPPN